MKSAALGKRTWDVEVSNSRSMDFDCSWVMKRSSFFSKISLGSKRRQQRKF